MRRHALPVTLLLPAFLALTACGDEQAEGGAVGLEAVTVTGQVGSAPKVTWNDRADTDELESEVLVEGRGEPVAADDQVVTHIWIGNGFAQTEEFSTYDKGSKPELLTVGDAELLRAFRTALEGRTIGSRVLVVAPPEDAFGAEGNPNLDIGNEDDVVLVVDLVDKVLDKPSGTTVRPPRDAPRVQAQDGVPTGLDFGPAPSKPPTKLQVVTLVRGDGRKVATGDTGVLNYLGQVYGSKKIFDQSYDKEPFTTTLGQGQVIQGWDRGLVGLPVGSRVVLVIPSDLAYGEQGDGADIPPDSTLAFVVDILAAY